jgi:hypothetical protein
MMKFAIREAGMSERTECERLRAINAELLEALKRVKTVALPPEITDQVYAAIAKAEDRS